LNSSISKTSNIAHYLLLSFSFLFPLSVFAGNLFAISILIYWFFEGRFKEKFAKIVESKLIVAYLLFFICHVVGLLWTDNFERGIVVVKKMLEFGLLLPIIYTLIKPENRYTYLYSFLASLTFIVILSTLIWLEFIEPFKNASVENPTPFMTHITHTPMIAFGSFIIGNLIFGLKVRSISNPKFVLLIILFLLFSVNVFITAGRTGQIAFIILLVTLIAQNFEIKLENIIKTFIGVFLILTIAFNFSETFENRFIKAKEDIINYQENPNTDVGLRMKFAENSLYFISENPIFGVGTGDFSSEYKKVNNIKSPALPIPNNPHNMYILILGQLGLFGLFSLLYGFYQQYQHRDKKDSVFKKLGVGLIVFFLVINLGDSYMLGHFTSFMFVFLTSIFFTSNEKK